MSFNIKNLKVGQVVYIKPVGNRARYISDDEILNYIEEAKIEKVGNKFFYLDGHKYSRCKFGTLHYKLNMAFDISEYSPNYEVYLSRQEIIDEVELCSLQQELTEDFSRRGKVKQLNLEQLKKIKAILDEII